jgi:hypothetical protein
MPRTKRAKDADFSDILSRVVTIGRRETWVIHDPELVRRFGHGRQDTSEGQTRAAPRCGAAGLFFEPGGGRPGASDPAYACRPALPRSLRPRVRIGGIENHLPWQLEIIFDADRGRTIKDFSPMTLAIARPIVLTMRKRDFRARLLAY